MEDAPQKSYSNLIPLKIPKFEEKIIKPFNERELFDKNIEDEEFTLDDMPLKVEE